jgi:hypothetical protein
MIATRNKPIFTHFLLCVKHDDHRTAENVLKCAIPAFHNIKWYIHSSKGDEEMVGRLGLSQRAKEAKELRDSV